MTINNKRIVSILILLAAILFMPWWLSVLLSLVFVLTFSNPYEVLFVGTILDSMYRLGSGGIFSDNLFFLSACAAFLLSFIVKEHFFLRA
jgi:hypothetical protein